MAHSPTISLAELEQPNQSADSAVKKIALEVSVATSSQLPLWTMVRVLLPKTMAINNPIMGAWANSKIVFQVSLNLMVTPRRTSVAP